MREINGSWIDYYLKSCDGQESPISFHKTVATSLISACLSDCEMYMGHFTIYPNTYQILVAGAGKCRKGQAIKMGVNRILKEIDNPPRMFAQKITPERLIQFLGEGVESTEGLIKQRATAYAVSEELSIFMGSAASKSSIVELLTELYDFHPTWSYEAKQATDERDELHNAGTLNLLAASTPDWLREALPYSALGGGFMSRTMFVYSDSPRGPFALPARHMPDNIEDIKKRLIHDLNIINEMKGTFEWTDEAADWYEDWYNNIFQQNYVSGVEDFFSRWHVYAVKFAMILSASESNEMVVTKEHIIRAVDHLSSIEGRMEPVIDNMITVESEMPTNKVLTVIKRRSPISHKELVKYARNFCGAEHLQKILETLEQSGEITGNLSVDDGIKIWKYNG